MAVPGANELARRLAEVEQQLKELKARLAALERATAPRAENPTDTAVVRKKVVYDWQG